MGFPTNGLIAPAILWKNPGITRDDFVELLDKTHSSNRRRYRKQDAWDDYNPAFEDKRYHQGIEGLKYFLGIQDWSQERGYFHVGPIGSKNFLWLNNKGKYSLDERTFDRIPASLGGGSWGYVELVLTSEALRHNAWKVLSYNGFCHFPELLKAFPDVKLQRQRAVWDSHTSLSAKLNGINTSDFLRSRLLGFWSSD